MLAEAVRGIRVERGFVYRIPDGKVFAVELDGELRERVRAAVAGMREMVEGESFPARAEVSKRCEECEYANYCGDVW